MDFDKLNKEVIPDQLTGDFQTIYWNNEHTFMMSIPHKGIQMPKDWIATKYETTKNEDGSTTWKLIQP